MAPTIQLSMDRRLFAATGLEAEPLREFIVTLVDDNEVAACMSAHTRATVEKIIGWRHRFRANLLWRLFEFEDWLISAAMAERLDEVRIPTYDARHQTAVRVRSHERIRLLQDLRKRSYENEPKSA